jgi:hypothetical protein
MDFSVFAVPFGDDGFYSGCQKKSNIDTNDLTDATM